MAGILLAGMEAALGGPLGGFRLGGAVETGDAMHADLGHGLLCAVLGNVLARLDLTDDLKVGALGQTRSVFGRTAERDAFVPGGPGFKFAGLAVFPGTFGRE